MAGLSLKIVVVIQGSLVQRTVTAIFRRCLPSLTKRWKNYEKL